MAKDSINYSEKIEQILLELPDFVSDFIYNFGQVERFATKFEYCRDIRDYFRFLIYYTPEHSEKGLKELTIDDIANVEPLFINRYLTMLAGNGKDGLKMSTVKRRRASISSMYSFYVANGKMKNNPVLATRPIRLPKKELIYLTDDEQALLLDTVQYGTNLPDKTLKRHNRYAERDSAMFVLLLDTGLRVSELLGTDIRDFNLDTCSVVVVRKGGDVQNVYYSDECCSYLREYFSTQTALFSLTDGDFPAFTTTTGNRLGVRAVETLVKKYVGACLPDKKAIISVHKLRSSFAMSFYKASDNDILLLQKRLNHASLTTTQKYATAATEREISMRNWRQAL